MSRRDQLMKELGLTAWHLRNRLMRAEEAGTGETSAPAGATMVPPVMPLAQEPDTVVTEQSSDTAMKVMHAPASPEPQAPQPVIVEENRDLARPATSPRTPRSWTELEQDVPACRRCALSETRTQTVFERGNRRAPLMIVGEAPGEQEDRLGQPFVGPAGKLLDAMLTAAGWNPAHDVYIANVLKCRPPGNRNPQSGEMVACIDFLSDQLRLVQPRLILCVGRIATQALLDTEQAISRLRGQLHHWQGVPLIVSYHPAYLLRNLPDKAKAWQDLCLARRTLAGLS